jgi:hypothetical protein
VAQAEPLAGSSEGDEPERHGKDWHVFGHRADFGDGAIEWDALSLDGWEEARTRAALLPASAFRRRHSLQ